MTAFWNRSIFKGSCRTDVLSVLRIEPSAVDREESDTQTSREFYMKKTDFNLAASCSPQHHWPKNKGAVHEKTFNYRLDVCGEGRWTWVGVFVKFGELIKITAVCFNLPYLCGVGGVRSCVDFAFKHRLQHTDTGAHQCSLMLDSEFLNMLLLQLLLQL